ncbi:MULTISPECIES: hypothetical protein [Carnobacterium]
MKLVVVETIKKDVCDFDRYDFEVKSPLSSKEYSVTIDFKNSEIRGDYVAYGEWNNLDIDECLEILDTLTEEEIKRDFSLIKKVVIEKRHDEIIKNMIEQEKKSKEIIEKEIKKMQVVIDSIPQNLYDKLERTNSQKISIDSFMNLFTDLEFVKNGGC